jgi:methionine salvage enolase-phosphatase E1
MTKRKFYNECKNQQLLWDLYAGIVRDTKKSQRLLWRLYVGIATNEKCQRLFVPYMRALQGMQNASGYYGTHMWVLQGM